MASQNETLLVAVFRQLAVTKLDYGILGKDLGLSREAARNRWVRFQAKIMQSANSNTAVPSNGEAGMPQTPPQTPSPKKKRAGTTKTKTASSKKRKRASSEDSDHLELNREIESEMQLDAEFGEYVEAEEKVEDKAGLAALVDRGELW
ncbi:hypothetical protein DL98DRAFT_537374 [Cadophora sp. DSE1049]|nr:hypothetical protein DL98DRAFT_537374 [Cadophora sp. DSE1049]